MEASWTQMLLLLDYTPPKTDIPVGETDESDGSKVQTFPRCTWSRPRRRRVTMCTTPHSTPMTQTSRIISGTAMRRWVDQSFNESTSSDIENVSLWRNISEPDNLHHNRLPPEYDSLTPKRAENGGHHQRHSTKRNKIDRVIYMIFLILVFLKRKIYMLLILAELVLHFVLF